MWVDATDSKQSGKGSWTARGRVIIITWQSRTVETWDLLNPRRAITNTLLIGQACTITPRW